LSWSHCCELVKIDNELERGFYYQQNILENWRLRELRSQKESGLFLRLASSKDKEKVLELARKGQSNNITAG
jgi:predicted nuclease of restriction endonuclease-like (RecB) superfamily